MPKTIWSTLLIALGLFLLYFAFISPAQSPQFFFFFLALALGCLGSGITLKVAMKKYPIPVTTAEKYIAQLEAENAALRKQLDQV